MILGDSVSVQYTLDVQKLLKGKANICRPTKPDGNGMFNTGGTANSLKMMDQEQWLADTKWAVVHFNYGIHDLTKKTHYATIEQYVKSLEELVKRFKGTGAKVVFATTTPLGKGLKGDAVRNADLVPDYNAAAVKFMQTNGVKINDLYAFALPQIEKILSKDNVHFTAEGSSLLAEQVAKAIEAEMEVK
jgi:acyl-CoA thioesterase-1